MDCDLLHLNLSPLSLEIVYDKQCEEKAWLIVVCLTVSCSSPHYSYTVYTCIGWANSTRCLNLQKQMISVWHVPVCESPIRYCFTYRCLRCYGHGGQTTLWKMTTQQVTTKGGGGEISLMVFTWQQPPCCEHHLTVTVYSCTSSYPRELLTGIGLMFTHQRLRAKSGKLWINTYFTNCKRRTLSTKSDKHSFCFGQFSNIR